MGSDSMRIALLVAHLIEVELTAETVNTPTSKWVVRWDWRSDGAPGPYVRNLRDNRRPYTTNIDEAKSWKTKKNAQRWVDGRSVLYAEQLAIVEIKREQVNCG